jgi:hypothetical protein
LPSLLAKQHGGKLGAVRLRQGEQRRGEGLCGEAHQGGFAANCTGFCSARNRRLT